MLDIRTVLLQIIFLLFVLCFIVRCFINNLDYFKYRNDIILKINTDDKTDRFKTINIIISGLLMLYCIYWLFSIIRIDIMLIKLYGNKFFSNLISHILGRSFFILMSLYYISCSFLKEQISKTGIVSGNGFHVWSNVSDLKRISDNILSVRLTTKLFFFVPMPSTYKIKGNKKDIDIAYNVIKERIPSLYVS